MSVVTRSSVSSLGASATTEGTVTVDSIQDQNERVWSLHESLVDAAISFLRKVRDANLDLQELRAAVAAAASPSLTPNSSPNPNIRNEWLSHLSRHHHHQLLPHPHSLPHHSSSTPSSASSASSSLRLPRHSSSSAGGGGPRSSGGIGAHSRRGSLSLLHTPGLYAALNSPQMSASVRGSTSGSHAGPPPFALSGGHHHHHGGGHSGGPSFSPFLTPLDRHHRQNALSGAGHAPMSPPPRLNLSGCTGGNRGSDGVSRQPFDLSLISPPTEDERDAVPVTDDAAALAREIMTSGGDSSAPSSLCSSSPRQLPSSPLSIVKSEVVSTSCSSSVSSGRSLADALFSSELAEASSASSPAKEKVTIVKSEPKLERSHSVAGVLSPSWSAMSHRHLPAPSPLFSPYTPHTMPHSTLLSPHDLDDDDRGGATTIADDDFSLTGYSPIVPHARPRSHSLHIVSPPSSPHPQSHSRSGRKAGGLLSSGGIGSPALSSLTAPSLASNIASPRLSHHAGGSGGCGYLSSSSSLSPALTPSLEPSLTTAPDTKTGCLANNALVSPMLAPVVVPSLPPLLEDFKAKVSEIIGSKKLAKDEDKENSSLINRRQKDDVVIKSEPKDEKRYRSLALAVSGDDDADTASTSADKKLRINGGDESAEKELVSTAVDQILKKMPTLFSDMSLDGNDPRDAPNGGELSLKPGGGVPSLDFGGLAPATASGPAAAGVATTPAASPPATTPGGSGSSNGGEPSRTAQALLRNRGVNGLRGGMRRARARRKHRKQKRLMAALCATLPTPGQREKLAKHAEGVAQLMLAMYGLCQTAGMEYKSLSPDGLSVVEGRIKSEERALEATPRRHSLRRTRSDTDANAFRRRTNPPLASSSLAHHPPCPSFMRRKRHNPYATRYRNSSSFSSSSSYGKHGNASSSSVDKSSTYGNFSYKRRKLPINSSSSSFSTSTSSASALSSRSLMGPSAPASSSSSTAASSSTSTFVGHTRTPPPAVPLSTSILMASSSSSNAAEQRVAQFTSAASSSYPPLSSSSSSSSAVYSHPSAPGIAPPLSSASSTLANCPPKPHLPLRQRVRIPSDIAAVTQAAVAHTPSTFGVVGAGTGVLCGTSSTQASTSIPPGISRVVHVGGTSAPRGKRKPGTMLSSFLDFAGAGLGGSWSTNNAPSRVKRARISPVRPPIYHSQMLPVNGMSSASAAVTVASTAMATSAAAGGMTASATSAAMVNPPLPPMAPSSSSLHAMSTASPLMRNPPPIFQSLSAENSMAAAAAAKTQPLSATSTAPPPPPSAHHITQAFTPHPPSSYPSATLPMPCPPAMPHPPPPVPPMIGTAGSGSASFAATASSLSAASMASMASVAATTIAAAAGGRTGGNMVVPPPPPPAPLMNFPATGSSGMTSLGGALPPRPGSAAAIGSLHPPTFIGTPVAVPST